MSPNQLPGRIRCRPYAPWSARGAGPRSHPSRPGMAVDGPAVFTPEQFFGMTILYRGSAADGPNRLGRGTCDTNPLVSNEVSACNGSPSYSDTDLSLPGKGLAFAFIRSYNAQDSRQGPLGLGWTHSLDLAITTNPFSTVAVVRKG